MKQRKQGAITPNQKKMEDYINELNILVIILVLKDAKD